MIQAYRIDVREKWTQADLTVELFGCNLTCHFCCSRFGRALPPRFHGRNAIRARILALARDRWPRLVRFTGGEFSIHGSEAMHLYVDVASTLAIPVVIETNATRPSFYAEFAHILDESDAAPPLFIVSVKNRAIVTNPTYDPERVVSNIRHMYRLFPRSYFAHGLLGFGRHFREALFSLFPELRRHRDEIFVEREGRHRFEALRVSDSRRDLYYFDQRIRVPQRTPVKMRARRKRRATAARGDLRAYRMSHDS